MAAKVVSWDWKEQAPMGEIGSAVWEISGHRCDIREVETGGDYYAVLVTDQEMTTAEAQAEFERIESEGS